MATLCVSSELQTESPKYVVQMMKKYKRLKLGGGQAYDR
jgi:hypothetical protein